MKRAYLTTGDLAELLMMHRSSIISSADAGRFGPVDRTPGGHRRFDPRSVAEALRLQRATVPKALDAMAGEPCAANAKDTDLHRTLRRGLTCACGYEGRA